MSLSRCMSCMEPISTEVCPHCGFSGEAQPEHALPYGTILRGRYLVGKVLGQGGFGITYVGWDLALEQKVAIKEYYPSGHVIRTGATGSVLHWSATAQALEFRESGVEGLLKEARKMARITRVPEATLVYDTFPENGTAYIVMEFVEGKTLKDQLAENGPYSWEQAKDIFLPAIRAMEAIHQVGIIHRDLSPDNLMLDPDGSVKILDLGAAKDLSVNSGASSMVVAKGGFSPLEQYTQRGASGPWTDVYAMAATVYYTLTGIVPQPAMERLEEDQLRWDIPQLQKLPQTVRKALKDALAVRAQDRTRSMAELLSNLSKEPAPEIPVSKETTPQKNQSEFKSKTMDQTASGPSKKRPGKKKIALVCGILVLILLLASAGTYFICYNKAVELCQPGSFEKAQELLWFPAVTDLHDPELNSYVSSGVSLEQGEYSAAQEGFTALGDYRNSVEMLLYSRYCKADHLADANLFDEAITEFQILSDLGYSDAENRILEVRYRKADGLADANFLDEAVTEFQALAELGYNDAENRVLEVRYRKACYLLAVEKNYNDACALFKELAQQGYPEADNMEKESIYLWAHDFKDKKEYLTAYQKFLEIKGYKDTDAVISSLNTALYESAQSMYRGGEYSQAQEIFKELSGYLRSEDYIFLCTVHCAPYPTAIYESNLRKLIGFEDASELLVSNIDLAMSFMDGRWIGFDGYYFKMDEAYFFSTNLPQVYYGNALGIENGKLYCYSQKYNGNTVELIGKRACFTFTVLTEDSIRIYCHIDGSTHTLYRQ